MLRRLKRPLVPSHVSAVPAPQSQEDLTLPQFRDWWGKGETREVPDVATAVAMAEEMSRKGTHDLFRGQRNSSWPVTSSLYRREEEEGRSLLPDFVEQVRTFTNWLSTEPVASILSNDVQAICAVMQHYSGAERLLFKTPMIDFTTEPSVAGFFAKDGASEGDTACIFCASSFEMEIYFEHINKANPENPRFSIARPQVPDLWRMQAQRGVFIWSVLPLDDVYNFDRIVFPVGRERLLFPKDRIYPIRKSRLEELIERYACYLDRVTRHDLWGNLQTFLPPGTIDVEALKQKSDAFLPVWLRGYATDSFKTELDDHPSWLTAANSDWGRLPGEDWFQFRTSSIFIDLGKTVLDFDAAKVDEVLTSQIDAIAEWKNVHLVFQVSAGQSVLSDKLAHVWDGMRALPFRKAQVVRALIETVRLHQMSLNATQASESPWSEDYVAWFGDDVSVEMSGLDNIGVRVRCSRRGLQEAIRPDLTDLLAEDYVGQRDPEVLMLWAWNPRKLFAFDAFAELYAREVIPVLVNLGGDTVRLFSPLSLHAFGRP